MEMFGVSIVSWTGLSGVGMGGVQPALPLSPHICKREQRKEENTDEFLFDQHITSSG